MKKIMIALDYDPTSTKVADAGFSIAKANNAEITLLHVMPNSVMYASANANMGVWQINAADSFEALKTIESDSIKFLEKTKKYLGDTAIKIMNKEGDAANLILQTAEEIKADCIVMGSHSQKWLENILMGSVAEEVLKETIIPILIVPTRNIRK